MTKDAKSRDLAERAEAYEYISNTELARRRKAHEALTEEKTRLEKRLKWQKKNPFLRAFGLFSFPFKTKAFEALNEALISLLCTIIFAGFAGCVALGAFLCVIADAVYCVLFVPFYPFAVLYLALFGKKSLVRTEQRLAALEKEMEKLDIATVEKAVASREARQSRESAGESSRSGSHTTTSGVKNTDYYKSKKDEYYRQYMGFPPKDDKPLSDLSTDTSLDIDVGDY